MVSCLVIMTPTSWCNWKTKMSSYSSLVPTMRTVALKDEVTEAEKLFLDQKLAVNNLFSVASTSERTGLIKRCQGGSASALKCFWSHLTKGVSQSSDITAVLSPVTGTLHCSPEAIITEVGNHLIKVFSGSVDSIPVLQAPCDHSYASGPVPATADPSSDQPVHRPVCQHLMAQLLSRLTHMAGLIRSSPSRK
jgi:hypothetical protein